MGQHRREDINGDTKQNCSNRRDLHQNREKMTTGMDKTCDMIVHIIPPNYTHTHTHTSINTHTSTHSSWWEGRLSDMATVRKVNLGRWACPMPWLILGFPHPLMQGSGLCSHTFISGTDRIGLCLAPHHTWSNVILIHIYIYHTITVFRFILFHSNSK